MDLVAREQMQTLKLDLNRPWSMLPGRQSAGAGQATPRPQVAEYDAVREEVRKLLAMPMAKHWPTLSMPTLRAGRARPSSARSAPS